MCNSFFRKQHIIRNLPETRTNYFKTLPYTVKYSQPDKYNPYIVFSYCHEDGERIYPIIEQMIDDGYRIWYDDGLRPGDEWPERIGRMLDGCTLCVAALSQKFSESHNCKNELTLY